MHNKSKSKPNFKLFSKFTVQLMEYVETNFAEKTAIIYKSVISHFQEMFGDPKLSEISLYHFDMYKTNRLKSIKPISVNVELRTLRAIFNTARKWKLITEYPFEGSKLVSVTESTPAFFTEEDFQKLMSLVKEDWFKKMIIVSVCLGLRRGELLNLRWLDIDMDKKLISIESNNSFKTKCGKKRIIAFNDMVYTVFNSIKKLSKSEYVFALNGEKISGSYVTHKFKYYIMRAKLNPQLHLHSLRHSHATWLVQKGIPIYSIKLLLGHSSVQTTEKFYAHASGSELHSAVNKINFSIPEFIESN
jgi:integrase